MFKDKHDIENVFEYYFQNNGNLIFISFIPEISL